MINELFVYGRKDSIFKSICAQITDILDRYHVSPNYGHDLNTSNLMKYIKDPNYGLQDVAKKYPMCVCVTPRSVPTIINGYRWEQFLFSLFFLKRTGYIDNTTLDNVDEEANVSMNEEPDSWSQMKNDAIQFLDILDATLKGTVTLDGKDVPFRQVVFYDNNRTGIRRLSNFNNDNISGVELDLSLMLSMAQCDTMTVGDITYLVNTFFQDSYEKILEGGTYVTVNSSEHKLNRVRGITLLDPSFKEVEIDDSIDGLTVTIRSNVDLNNHKLIIF
jgi:hypothetical protein